MVADTLNMRDLRQWLCWRSEERDGKPTKILYSPLTGHRASSPTPETWTGYQEAVKACKEHGYGGIGFVFTPEDDLCGVDLDGCLDLETGEIEPWAWEVIEELDSYTEISPSGTGVHILVRGELPEGRNRKGRFEAYDRGRYFTVTGRHLSGTPQSIESRQEELLSVVRRVFGEESTNGHKEHVSTPGSAANGLSDDEIIRKALSASNGERFSRLWAGDTNGYGSHSEADLALCGMLAFWSGGDTARTDTLFRQSGLYRKKWDRKDYRNRTITEALSGKTEFYKAPKTVKLADGTEVAAEEEERKPTQAELLIRCAAGAELFHTPAGDSYATVSVGDHQETHPIKSKGFRRWIVRAYFEQYDRPPGAQAMQDALGLLEARAEFDGLEREVYIRIAGHGGNIYVDLANEDWQTVEITAASWRVIESEAAPVRFRRPRGTLALPFPANAGPDDADDLLRRFINVFDEDSLRLIAAWIVQAYRPTGPYPILLFQGEQGSAKSTVERLVRAVVDPSAAPLRTTPRSEHDLYIAADNAHVVALDNISSLQPWLSDALCRLSTGGGFSTRTLYENREQELFDGMKPTILNGITDVATRPDLLDRALLVTLPPIPDVERKPEAELWVEFEKARPAILGALFSAVSGALRSVDGVRLEGMPRMADFAVWATAAESALGWEAGAFIAAYTGNREEATQTALEADPAAGAVRTFMQERNEWIGTATELWKALGELVDEGVRHAKVWPGAPNALTARLKRLAPTLRGIGIEYGEVRTGKTGSRKKKLTKKEAVNHRHKRQHRQPDAKTAKESQIQADGPADGLVEADGPIVSADDPTVKDCQPENLIDKGNPRDADSSDGADDDLQPVSKEEEVTIL
jgi:hypothetical protein